MLFHWREGFISAMLAHCCLHHAFAAVNAGESAEESKIERSETTPLTIRILFCRMHTAHAQIVVS
jgi:hypothetical protein